MKRPSALLIDIDGVLVVSWEPIPGAVESLDAIRAAGVSCRFLTNSTALTRADIARTLQDCGFDLDMSEVLTTTAATAAHLRSEHPGAKVWMLNSGDVSADMDGIELVSNTAAPGTVEVVVLGGAGPEFSYEALNHVLQCLLEGAALVAMHRSTLWRTSAGLQLDTGAYLSALESVTGTRATVIGKPAPAMFAAGLEAVGAPAEHVAMIGDDINTDVRAAKSLGIAGVQVRTGKFTASQLDDGEAPDVVLDSFADVPVWLGL